MPVVRNHTALFFGDPARERFSAPAPRGTHAFITYSFTSAADLPGDPAYGVATLLPSHARRAVVAALSEASKVSGVTFVHVSRGGMLEFGGERKMGSVTGYAYSPYVGDDGDSGSPGAVRLATDKPSQAFARGGSMFETTLHEIGHALGLKHPFEGPVRLARDLDNTANTLMSYTERGGPYASFRRFDVAALRDYYGEAAASATRGWTFSLGADGVFRVAGSAQADVILGVAGSNRLSGKSGADRLYGRASRDTLSGDAGADTLRGFAGADRLHGGADGDLLVGGDGGDRLYGDAGNDRLEGGDGDDLLRGGVGNDRLQGGNGDDHLDGGPGADTISGGYGATLVGGSGADRISAASLAAILPGPGDDSVFGDFGRVTIEAGGGADRISGDWAQTSLTGWIVSAVVIRGADVLIVGIEGDSIRLVGAAAGGSVPTLLVAANVSALHAAVDHGGFGLIASSGSADYSGSPGSVLLRGGAAADTLRGGDGADLLFGGGGDDVISGGDGRDQLTGGPGADVLHGGRGFDVASYAGSTAGVVVSLRAGAPAGDAAGDRLVSIEGLAGGPGADRLTLGDAAGALFGGDGADTLTGGRGADSLRGGAGADILLGADGGDRLSGGDGTDRLSGGTGPDRIEGGRGDDRLQGGAGPDVFVFDADFGSDLMLDFKPRGDVIDFRPFGAFAAFSDLTFASAGGDAILLAPLGGSIRFDGVAVAQLSGADFLFA